MKRPSPTFAGLDFWPVPSGKKDSNPALGIQEKPPMRIYNDRNQFDQETQTDPASHGVGLSLVEFWRDQLNRIKEYAESQAATESEGAG
ncbi:MAG TPA: hypothetical protein VJP02_15750 [Candidatus Sulfotelmatobacter sp.]|nr:hypothetical protein [Candidatus Sulfotelmatobacter sp.]